MGSSTHKAGGRKHGRDRDKCARYRASGRREKNKARRKAKEIQRQARLKIRRKENEGKV